MRDADLPFLTEKDWFDGFDLLFIDFMVKNRKKLISFKLDSFVKLNFE